MATALAKGFVQAGLLTGDRIAAYDPSEQALQTFSQEVEGVGLCESNAELFEKVDVVVLAVKPPIIGKIAESLKNAIDQHLIVSIAAGVRLETLQEKLGTDRVIRVMPNTPALVGEGAAGFSLGSGATNDDALLVGTLLSSVGIAFRLEEKLLDALTGVSGSGPAFVYLMIEALADGGVNAGLPREVALKLAAQTVRGAGTMVAETGKHPGVLKDQVTSPAGTTIAGIAHLEQAGFRGAVMGAVGVAAEKARQLGG